MTKQQLIEAMSLIGLEEDSDYSIGVTYESIVMLNEDVEKPEENYLQEVYDAEQARIAEEARLSAIQTRIDAIPDLVLAIDAYIKGDPYPGEEGAFNLAGFKTATKLESDFGWDFPNKPKPSIDDLESLGTTAKENNDWSVLRSKRDQLLTESDWTQMPDAMLDNQVLKNEWANYRQVLRDLPENTEDPANPSWPEKPE